VKRTKALAKKQGAYMGGKPEPEELLKTLLKDSPSMDRILVETGHFNDGLEDPIRNKDEHDEGACRDHMRGLGNQYTKTLTQST
jgi:hypothetical protein